MKDSSVFLLVILLCTCGQRSNQELKNDIYVQWSEIALKSVNECALEGKKREAKKVLSFIEKNQIRSKILAKLMEDSIFIPDTIAIIESYGGDPLNYSVMIRLDSLNELHSFSFDKSSKILTHEKLNKSSKYYENNMMYFNSWDMPPFICDKEYYLVEFYIKIPDLQYSYTFK